MNLNLSRPWTGFAFHVNDERSHCILRIETIQLISNSCTSRKISLYFSETLLKILRFIWTVTLFWQKPYFDTLILTPKKSGVHLTQNFALIPMVPLTQKCQNFGQMSLVEHLGVWDPFQNGCKLSKHCRYHKHL